MVRKAKAVSAKNGASPTQLQRHRSVPIRSTITRVGKGYPDKLTLFKIPASSFWWVRYYTQGKLIKRSTKTQQIKEAISFAKKFYEDVLLRERNLLPLTASPSFEKCAAQLIDEQEHKIARGELNPRLNANDKAMLQKELLPFFRGADVKAISYKQINEFSAKLAKRGLSNPTIKKYLNLLSKILRLANREGLLDRLPQLPALKVTDSPRGWFSEQEYDTLKKTVAHLIQQGKTVRGHKITDEFRLLITFMVNTFLRPSDIKLLRHRNIEVVEGSSKFLRITTEQSKTSNTSVVSMEFGVGIYKDILKYHGKVKQEDFVFFPKLKNRDFALQTMRRIFDEILKLADLKHARTGEPRTLYSLRHTAIMFRLTLGDKIDLLTLARNARTSVDMIERFYARPLLAEMNIEKIQSTRKRTPPTPRK